MAEESQKKESGKEESKVSGTEKERATPKARDELRGRIKGDRDCEILKFTRDPKEVWQLVHEIKPDFPHDLPAYFIYALEDPEIILAKTGTTPYFQIYLTGFLSSEKAFELGQDSDLELMEDWTFFDDGSVIFQMKPGGWL